MQKILIPTDFSILADNAMNYAIEIGSAFDAELYLYHVYHMHKVDYNLNFTAEEQPYRKKLEQKMSLKKLKFAEKIKQKGLNVQTVVEEDSIYSLFESKAIKHDINWIIMSSKGASGMEKVIFGSAAVNALEVAKVPVLVVPPEYTFQAIKHIVLATDLAEVSSKVLIPLQRLASTFDATVTILNVNTGTNGTEAHKINLSLQNIETTYREVPMANSINESINQFIEENNCDILCMIRREKGFFERLFKRSITKTQLYNNLIPLLVLPEND